MNSLNDDDIVADGYTPEDATLESTYEDGTTCVSQQVYIDSGNEKKVLYLLSVGLSGPSGADNNDDSGVEKDKPLFSFDDEPWSLLPKSVMRPQSKDYVTEIVRRASLFAISPLPRPVNWPRTRQMEWLESHPIKDQADITFLTAETLRLKQMLLRRALEQQVLPSDLAGAGGGSVASGGGNTRGGGSNWRGIVPYLRLIMCFTQDDIKAAFLRRADAPSRAELDARNSERRSLTAFELISNLWNDKDYNPRAPSSSCHSDYVSSIDCSYNCVAHFTPATPKKVLDSFTSMRTDLLRIIRDWERSGQGEGGSTEEEEEQDDVDIDEEQQQEEADISMMTTSSLASNSHGLNDTIGGLRNRPARALHLRQSFLNGRPSYLLYFWEVADSHQLLQSSLQCLTEGNGAADASSAPTTVTATRLRGRQDAAERQEVNPPGLFEPLAESLNRIASIQETMVEQRIMDREHQKAMEENRFVIERSEHDRKRKFERRSQLTDKAREFRRARAELDMNDPRAAALLAFFDEECELIMQELDELSDVLSPAAGTTS